MSYSQHVDPPFSVAMMPDGLWIEGIEMLNGCRGAIDEFVRYCLPPIDGRTACVIDADGVVVIGYALNPLGLQWFGTTWAVSMLRLHSLVEPALMVSIEMALEPT